MRVRTKDGRILQAWRVYKRRKGDYKKVKIMCLQGGILIEPGSPEAELSLFQATPEEERDLRRWGFHLPHHDVFIPLPTPQKVPLTTTIHGLKKNGPDMVMTITYSRPDGSKSRPIEATVVDPMDLPSYDGVPDLDDDQVEEILHFLDEKIHRAWGNKKGAEDEGDLQASYAFRVEALAYERARDKILFHISENATMEIIE